METGLTATMPARLGEAYDLVIAMHPHGRGEGEFLRREQAVWATSASHASKQQEPLPVALYPQGCLFRKWAMEALDAAKRPWRLAFVSHSLAAVEVVAAQGLAVTVVKAGTFPPSLRLLSEQDGLPRLPAADICLHRATDLSPAARCSPIIYGPASRTVATRCRCGARPTASFALPEPSGISTLFSNISLYDVSVWVLPVVIAITFHEAAHAFAAHRLGDNTAWQLGRVTLNPFKHIDPFGTVILPGLLLLSHSPFLFGYAKPVPVNFRNLNNPRLDMVWVALAGPAINIVLAVLAGLAFHSLPFVPANAAQWTLDNLKNTFLINIVLAIFNMLPIPPLDGGRVAVGLLPRVLAYPLSRLEPYGMLILIGLLILLPIIGTQLGLNLDVISVILRTLTGYVIRALLFVTGNA